MSAQPEGLIRSVVNALRILDEIGVGKPIGVSELSCAIGLPKTSVFRALRTLEECRAGSGRLTHRIRAGN